MSSTDEDVLLACAAFFYIASACKKKKKRARRLWQRSLFRNRSISDVSCPLSNLSMQEEDLFHNFNRMSSTDFETLIKMVGPLISKRDTTFRKAIPVKDRLAITLRFLATGDSYTRLMYIFKISKQTISIVIPAVCDALITVLHQYVKMPNSSEDWLKVAKMYEDKWQFPHCIGAVDSKRIRLHASINNGNDYFKSKSYYDIILMAAADADYSFLFANIKCQEGIYNDKNFKNIDLSSKIRDEMPDLPPASPLLDQETNTPYIFVAGDTFPLHQNIMKPYPDTNSKISSEIIFNHRSRRVHRVIENSFGILASVFRVLQKPLLLEPKKAISIVLACVHLHNYLRKSESSQKLYSPDGTFDSDNMTTGGVIEGSWRKHTSQNATFQGLYRICHKSTVESQEIRNNFTEYFSRT